MYLLTQSSFSLTKSTICDSPQLERQFVPRPLILMIENGSHLELPEQQNQG